MLAADYGSIWAAIIPVCASIIGGAFVMAWRLGSLNRTVQEHGEDMRDMTNKLEKVTNRLELVERQMMEQGRIMGGRRRTDPHWPTAET